VNLVTARQLAEEFSLDLVEISPTAQPPVCKLIDYSHYKYEQDIKARESRRNQAHTTVKEIKLRPKITDHDMNIKLRQAAGFLEQGHRVKVTISFKGREHTRPELGQRLIARTVHALTHVGTPESMPNGDSRSMTMLILPLQRHPS